jgi:hypothetical protein
MRTRRRWPEVLAVLLAALLAVGGCGVGGQGEPELLAAENVPDGLLDPSLPTSTTTPATPETSTVLVFFVRVQSDVATLEAVAREVTNIGSLTERLTALLEQPPSREEADFGLQTAIPPGTALVEPPRISAERQMAIIDLTSEFLDNQGQGQRTAFAQIVLTATRTPGVDRVRFQIEGEDHAAIVGDGSTRNAAVGPADYLPLVAPVDPEREPDASDE